MKLNKIRIIKVEKVSKTKYVFGNKHNDDKKDNNSRQNFQQILEEKRKKFDLK